MCPYNCAPSPSLSRQGRGIYSSWIPNQGRNGTSWAGLKPAPTFWGTKFGVRLRRIGATDVEAFSMEFNKTEFVQSFEVVPGIDPAYGAGTGAHS